MTKQGKKVKESEKIYRKEVGELLKILSKNLQCLAKYFKSTPFINLNDAKCKNFLALILISIESIKALKKRDK